MPELGEIAHITAVLGQFLVGKTIKSIDASEDSIVYPGLSVDKFESTLLNRRVEAVERHGKYFWLKLNPVQKMDNTVLIHFGMTGWIKVKGWMTHFMVMENGGSEKAIKRKFEATPEDFEALKQENQGVESKYFKSEGAVLDPIVDIMELKPMSESMMQEEVWPPKWSKFVITTEDNEQIAMIDPRRLAKIRLFNVETEAELMTHDPMSRQGVDFSKPQQVATWGGEARFIELMAKKVTKIKSLLLDQAVFAGIGNWMGDEILYHAHIHPLSRACDLNLSQVKELYKYVVYVCEYVVKYEANTNLFPANWLMLYRWKVGRSAKTKTKTKTKAKGKPTKRVKVKSEDEDEENDDLDIKEEESYHHDEFKVVLDKVSVGGRTSVFAPETQRLSKKV